MVASAFCSAMMSTCTKLVPGVPAMEKTLFTAFVCMIAAWIVQYRRHHEAPHFLRKDVKDLTLRAIYGIISMWLTFWCASAMEIGDAQALFNLGPSFTMIYAHFAMNERFDRKPQKLPRIRRQRLHVATLTLGVERVEGQRRFSRARNARDDNQLVAWNLQADVFQVIDPRTLDFNVFCHLFC